jgi:transcriptional regulator with XRE-family HTH domain
MIRLAEGIRAHCINDLARRCRVVSERFRRQVSIGRSQVERGKRNITIVVLARLAAALHTTPDRLVASNPAEDCHLVINLVDMTRLLPQNTGTTVRGADGASTLHPSECISLS